MWAKYPHVLLDASGEAVGLPAGVMGNSEVGHLTIGSGRVIYQDLSRINRAVADGSFFTNPVLDPGDAAALPADAPRFAQPDGRVKTSAAWLIEHAGVRRGERARRVAPRQREPRPQLRRDWGTPCVQD